MDCLFVNRSDNGRNRVLKNSLDNKHIMGKYANPNNMEEALELLDNYNVVSGGT